MVVENLEVQVSAQAATAAKTISDLATELSRLNGIVNNGTAISSIANLGTAIGQLSGASNIDLSGLVNSLSSISAVSEQVVSGLNDMTDAIASFSDAAAHMPQNLNIPGASADAFTNSLRQATQIVDDLNTRVNALNIRLNEMNQRFNNIGRTAPRTLGRASNGIVGFARTVRRMFVMRLIRQAIMSIIKGIGEGMQAAYNYSKTLNGSLYQAMNRVATASNTLKAQLGAAFASALEALAPIIIRIVNLLTKLANVLTQIFSAFAGNSTYLVAEDVATGWGKATGAAKEYKRTIAGFDELNVLNSPDSGSGGGGGNGMKFKMAEINPKILETIKWIKNHLEDILGIAGLIGIAIAAWKLANFLGDTSILFQFLITVSGIVIAIKSAIDMIANGINWKNLSGYIIGIAMAATGLGIAFGPIGAAIAVIAGGIGLLVVGVREFIRTGEMSAPVLAAIEIGLLAVGAAISLLTGSWIPLAIAAVVGIVTAVLTNWQSIVKIFGDIKTAVSNFFKEIDRMGSDFFGGFWVLIKGWINIAIAGIAGFVNSVIGGVNGVIQTLINVASLAGIHISAGLIGTWNPPRLAKGGIVNGPMSAIIGEDGKEAVVPLENNTEWIDKIASKLSASISNSGSSEQIVKVYLDGKQITNAVTKRQGQNARAMGV